MSKWSAKIEELYERYPQPRTLDEDLAAHHWTGYIIDRDDYFLVGRPVDSSAPEYQLRNPWRGWAWYEKPDCWMIWAYAGPPECMLTAAPYWLPKVCWSRRNRRIKIYDTATALDAVRKMSNGRAISIH